jgi:hypothetical protein
VRTRGEPAGTAAPSLVAAVVRVAGAVAVYVAVVGFVVWWADGIPASRDLLVPLLVCGIAAASATSIARFRKVVVALVVDWPPFVLALWL